MGFPNPTNNPFRLFPIHLPSIVQFIGGGVENPNRGVPKPDQASWRWPKYTSQGLRQAHAIRENRICTAYARSPEGINASPLLTSRSFDTPTRLGSLHSCTCSGLGGRVAAGHNYRINSYMPNWHMKATLETGKGYRLSL